MARNKAAKPVKNTLSSAAEGIRGKITAMLELPKEVVFNLPIIEAVGYEDVNITNYKGLLEYSDELIRVSAGGGTIRLEGSRLTLRQVTAESVSISGRIKKIEFV